MDNIFLATFLVVFAVASLIEIICMPRYKDEFMLIFPYTIYTHTKLNWFGAWFIFILISIINPILLIIKLLFVGFKLLIYGIKYIFTVGR